MGGKCQIVKYVLYREVMEDGKLSYQEVGRYCSLYPIAEIVGMDSSHIWKYMTGRGKPKTQPKGIGYKVAKIPV